jgi:DNA-directed RNA polymerase subunit RPC12/RpoP
MSILHHLYSVHCSVCLEDFDLRRTRPALSARPLKTHDVYQCPHCGYLVAIERTQLLA